MPTRRLRKSEVGVGTGHGSNPTIVMPGVSWCSACKTVSPKNDTPWNKYICTRDEKECCYRNWYKYSTIKVTRKPTKKEVINKRNLETIKLVAKRGQYGTGRCRNKKSPCMDVGATGRRCRNLHM